MWRSYLDCCYAELITAGCDSRLLTGVGGLNRYGCSASPRSEFALGSCSCSSPTRRGTAAAEKLITQLRATQTPKWIVTEAIGRVRSGLRRYLDLPIETDIALTPSGTDAELLAVALADRGKVPIVNLIVGPGEVGSGTIHSASGRHYDFRVPRGNRVTAGDPVDEQLATRIRTETVAIRDSQGHIRAATEIDAEIHERVAAAAQDGCRVLVHAVAHSKTGIFAPRLQTLETIKATLKDDADVLIDAAQGRLGGAFGTASYRDLLQRGFMVNFTGSKFFGGPPFSGALLVPRSMRVDQRAHPLPESLGNYFSRPEMPASWRTIRNAMDSWINIPALVRWVAAINEIAAFDEVPSQQTKQIIDAFRESMVNHFSRQGMISLRPTFNHHTSDWSDDPAAASPTVFSFSVETRSEAFSKDELIELHRSVNDPTSSIPIQLGQPVSIAPGQSVMRIAVGAPLVVQVANDLTLGPNLKSRLRWMDRQLAGTAARVAEAARKLDRSRTIRSELV